jgi:hypothetical protein
MSPAENGILAIRVDLLTFTRTIAFPFLADVWTRFSLFVVSLLPSTSVIARCRISHLTKGALPDGSLYDFVCCCGVGREGSRKGSREGQIEGEFPHTLLSTSSIISAFLCGSPPFEVYFIYLGLSRECSIKLVARGRHL